MPVAVSYPGVYVQEVSSGVRTITGVATSIALFIGWAPKGPTDKARRITSFADFERLYGGLVRDVDLGYAVSHFYANGGSDAYVIRVAGGSNAPAHETVEGFLVTAISPGLWGNDLEIKKTATGPGSLFKLEVLDWKAKERNGDGRDVVLESFVGLSDDPNNARYAPKFVTSQSAYIKVELATSGSGSTGSSGGTGSGGTGSGGTGSGGTGSGGTGSGSAGTPPAGSLKNGNDGAPLLPNNPAFVTAAKSLFDRGGAADQIDLFNLICIPGLTNPGALGELLALAKEQRAFLLADCEQDVKVSDFEGTTPQLPGGSDKDYGAYYFPWVMAPDPLQLRAVREFPPCGFVAGIMARTDSERGVWKAPAGTDAVLNGAAGLKIDMSDRENGQLNPKAINCLRTFAVYGNVVWGARTLDGDDNNPSDWKYVPVRRLALYIEESLYRGTQWVVFEPNDEPLWAQIRLNVGAFMNTLFKQGAFQGTSPKDAYFVKCDKETTPQGQINLGIVNIVVGFAPLKPAEFVILTIQQMAGQIQV